MKERGILFSGPMVRSILAGRKGVTRRLNKMWLKVKQGDLLYVRECWNAPEEANDHTPSELHREWLQENIRFRADGAEKHSYTNWRPSIHLPRWASRIDLDATEDARLEHLQDITEEEAVLEGVEPNWAGPLDGWNPKEHGWMNYLGGEDDFPAMTALESFETLWRSLHHKPGETWEDNPELVRIAFDWRTK